MHNKTVLCDRRLDEVERFRHLSRGRRRSFGGYGGSRMNRMGKVSYFGVRERGAALVFRYRPDSDPGEGAPLDLRLDLRKHSPSGPEWGVRSVPSKPP